jgi:hypothetical protein
VSLSHFRAMEKDIIPSVRLLKHEKRISCTTLENKPLQ